MPRGYRCIIIAAVGWIALTGAHPKPAASPEQPYADSRVGDALSNIAANYDEQTKRSERSPKSPPCGPRQYQSKDDLCAQWEAADAAADAAGWAAWGTWLSGISLFAVAIAILLTIESNRIARDTAKRQLRAYIAIEPLGVEEFAENGLYRVPINIINNGQTPAYNLELFGDFLIVEGDPREFDPVEHGRLLDEGATTDSTLGPNSNRVTYAYIEADLVNPNHHALEAKTKAIVHYGYLRYEDAFGEPRKACFAFYHWGEELSAAESKRCRFGNGAD